MVIAIPDGGGGAPVVQAAQTGLPGMVLNGIKAFAQTLVQNAQKLVAMFTGHGALTLGTFISAAAPIAAAVVGTWLAIKAFCGIKKAIQNHHGKVGRSATIDPNAAPAETPVAMNTPTVQQEQYAGQTP